MSSANKWRDLLYWEGSDSELGKEDVGSQVGPIYTTKVREDVIHCVGGNMSTEAITRVLRWRKPIGTLWVCYPI